MGKEKKRSPVAGEPKARHAVPALSRKKRLGFAVAAALLVPVLLLILLETGLRLGDYGYPTTFFLERNENGETFLVENDKFGWRFFPRDVARSPSVLKFRKEKAPGTVRILLFGESAALGDPKPGYGMGRYLHMLLKERYPEIKFEVIPVAMTAINSHAILPMARESRKLDADYWVIYMGNNEMAGPYGANPIFGKSAPNLTSLRLALAFRATKTGQLFENILAKARDEKSNQVWEGMKMFVEHQVPPLDPRREKVYRNFQGNLEEIIDTGLGAGAKIVLCTVAGNLKDFPPLASLPGKETGAAERTNLETLMQRARQSHVAQLTNETVAALQAALQVDAHFAEAHYRLGEAALAVTNVAEARASFSKARDYDALPFRTDSKQNEIIRNAAQRFAAQGVRLLDSEEALTKLAAGVLGDETFFDHVHFKLEGNYQMGVLLARELENQFPSELKAKATGDWAAMEAIEQRLGLTDFNRRTAYEQILQRLFDAPFTNQFNHLPRAQALAQKIRELRENLHPRVYFDTRAIYEEALAKEPEDYRLRENFAEFLEQIGELEEAAGEWRKVANFLSHHHVAFFHAGRLSNRLKKDADAKGFLSGALEIRPDLVEARLELGQVFQREKNYESAMAQYTLARKQRPTEAKVLVQMADLQASQNNRGEALKSLQQAVELRPSYWEARYLLGVELAGIEKVPEALAQFHEVVKLKPDYASGHFNLAVALAKIGRLPEALHEFQETLRCDPDHKLARQYATQLEQSVNQLPK